MKANTYSLLNSHWMITSSGVSSMMPQLLSLIKGNELKEVEAKLPVVFMQMEDDSFSEIPEMSSNSQYITVLSIKTPLFKYDQFCGPVGTRSMMRVLKEWEANDNVVGVVLDIDCPGGQVSGLSEFCEFLNNYSKPIVAYTDGLMASAAYYVASACKHIVCNPNADFVGSIGTMLTYVDLDGIIEAEGGIIKNIYATGSPRKNEESRQLKEGSDSLIIKNILDPARDKFVADVNLYHPGIEQSVFEGAIYKPSDALTLNLVNELGTLQTAFDKVVELSKPNKKSNSKSNTNMNTKSLPKVEAVLGLDAPLASTDNGSYLNEEQLSTIEARLDSLESENSTLQTQATDAQTANTTAVNAITNQLTEATNSLTAVEASVDAILNASGLPVTGTVTEKLAAINGKAEAFGKLDGAKPTNVHVESDNKSVASNIVGGVDVSAAMNN